MRLSETVTHNQTIISQFKLSTHTHTHTQITAMCIDHVFTLSPSVC